GRPIPRRADWNGESKWDSAATYINEFLRPVSELVRNSLEWRRAKIWSIRSHQDAGVNAVVNYIVSMKQDAADPIDEQDSTFVIVSEFVHRITDENYLLVLNGRTHPIEGHRHITVKLDLAGSPDTKWLVENVLTGDIWLVRPTATPDPLTTANGFTDYFKPGDAALYRLVPADRPETLLPADFPANFFVTPDAAMTMTASNVHTFQPYKGVFVDGSFFAYGAQFTAANEVWQGIHARNDGSVYLDNCVLDGGGVVAGSLGSATVVDTRIDNVPYALYNVGGSLYSTRTLASECSDGYAWIDGPITYIDTDAATATSWPASWGSGIDMHGGGFVDICNTTLSGFVTGVFSRGGMLTTDIVNRLLDGRNHINAVSNVLITDKEGWIDFGDTLGGYGTNNCFSLQDLVNGYHVWGGGNGVNAVDSYWGSQQLNLFGTYNIGATRLVCGIPFTGETGARQLSKSMTPPPANNTKRALMQAYRDSNHVLLRSLLCMQCGSHRSTGKRLISSGIPQFDARISRICATHS
ncbi:MAG: hypothetical protein KFF77_12035, partial [Bacteroidetes bacterium]|nr:hypothetical protein [Bacteroidota bacterium]